MEGTVSDFNQQPVRFEQGNYRADVLRHTTPTEQFWYYVVQRKASNEVIDLVKFDSYEQAMEAAQQVLAKMHRAIAGG